MTTADRPVRTIACVGEVMIELVAGQNGQATLGVAGDTFNTAVYLVRQLAGAEVAVSYVTALGTDPYSRRIEAAIEAHGIGTGLIEHRDGAMPGLYAIDTDEAGERSFSYWRSASAARTLFSEPCDIGLDRLNAFDLVVLSGISLAILPMQVRHRMLAWIEDYRAQGGRIAYDSNHRPRLWDSPETARAINAAMWARADFALPSVDDEMALFGDTSADAVVARLHALGARRGALKCGAKGPIDLASGNRLPDLPAPTKVVDSTAAGDSFNAGYLAGIVTGKSDEEAIRAGHALALKVIGAPGAIIDAASVG